MFVIYYWKQGGEIDRTPDLILDGFEDRDKAESAAFSLVVTTWDGRGKRRDNGDIWVGDVIAASVRDEKDSAK